MAQQRPTREHEGINPVGVGETRTTTTASHMTDAMPRRAVVSDAEVAIPEAYNLTRDRVRWGPVVAGFLTALTTLILMGILGAAVGFTVIDAGEVAARDAAPEAAGPFSAIWAAISGLVAFWLGGMVAGRTSAVFDRKWGAFNGAMVFFLAIPVTLWLATMGLGSLVGSLGNFAAALNADPATAQNAAQAAANQAQGTAAAARQATPEQIAAAAAAARNSAWLALLGLGLALGAATLGGMMGTRRELELDRSSGAVTDH
jgi:hypothetical protein